MVVKLEVKQLQAVDKSWQYSLNMNQAWPKSPALHEYSLTMFGSHSSWLQSDNNILAMCPADALHFYGSKDQKTSIAASCLLYFTSGAQDVSHVQPLVIIWIFHPSVFIRGLLPWVTANAIILHTVRFLFTNLRMFVLHWCWPQKCNIDGWGDIVIVLFRNLNHLSAILKNVQWCWSGSLWYDTWTGSPNKKLNNESQIVFWTKSYNYFKSVTSNFSSSACAPL